MGFFFRRLKDRSGGTLLAVPAESYLVRTIAPGVNTPKVAEAQPHFTSYRELAARGSSRNGNTHGAAASFRGSSGIWPARVRTGDRAPAVCSCASWNVDALG
jgi:hypothetical protein